MKYMMNVSIQLMLLNTLTNTYLYLPILNNKGISNNQNYHYKKKIKLRKSY